MHNAYEKATNPFKKQWDDPKPNSVSKYPNGYYGGGEPRKPTPCDYIIVHNQDNTYAVARSRSENLISYEVVTVCHSLFEAQTIRTMYSEREGAK